MSRKIYAVSMIVGMSLAMLISGCKPSANLNLQFSPDQTTRYKAVSNTVKDFSFEQPNLGKSRKEQTKTSVEMTYTQTIQSVDAEGNAVAKIKIDSLMINIINKNEQRLAFDSSKKQDKNNPLAKLIGQSYTIQITTNGKVKLLEAQKAISAVPSGYENKVASSLLNKENIAQRHQIQAVPEAAGTFNTGDSWTVVVPSPPGLLAPKSYEKVYTLSNVGASAGKTVATIKMAASESAEPAQGVSAGGMGMFAKMFDNEDTFTGSMTLDVNTGTVLSAEETLVSTYLAQEMPENADPAKGPDTLTMKFTHHVGLKKLN